MLVALVQIIILITAITYIIKFYKFKKFAENEFVNYQSLLEEEKSIRQEEHYIHESEMHLYKEEHGELNREDEEAKIHKDNIKNITALKQDGVYHINLRAVLEQIDKIYSRKEEEKAKRLEAEKNISLALQKNKEIEQKVIDLQDIQEANNQMMEKIADTLYDKISQDLKQITQDGPDKK